MKLFGKRSKKTAIVAEVKPQEVEEEAVSSYFSSDFKPPSSNTESKEDKSHDIEKLLAMDPSELNAKQRRVLKRHTKRQGVDDNDADKNEPTKSTDDGDEQQQNNPEVVSEENDDKDTDEESDKSPEDTSKGSEEKNEKEEKLSLEEVAKQLKGLNAKERRKLLRKLSQTYDEEFLAKAAEASKKVAAQNETKQQVTKAVTASEASSGDIEIDPAVADIANQLKGLNSKERRKLLRQLSSQYDEELLAKATDVSKKIAEENEAKQAQEQNEKGSKKRKAEDESASTEDKNNSESASSEQPKSKKKKWQDFSHLPPEERERREKQRQMQQEAAARRAAGEVSTRHPLNSERRRANRRKPGKAGKIRLMRLEKKANQGTLRAFNAGGYQMRRNKN